MSLYDFVDSSELSQIMAKLHCVLKVRITFFDMQGGEWSELSPGELSPYCSLRRQDAQFNQKCKDCDQSHLLGAKSRRELSVYHCHNGLIEGIVPLYDQNKAYLGAIVFGQVHDREQSTPAFESPEHEEAYRHLHQLSLGEARDIAELLKYVSESIIHNELLKKKQASWSSILRQYIAKHLSENLSISDLAKCIERSPSFISHHFKDEFGMSPMKYIETQKMNVAMDELKKGTPIKSISFKLGYFDEFHFSKSFKKHWGQSPKKFKRLKSEQL